MLPMNGQFGRHEGRIASEPEGWQRAWKTSWSLADRSTIAVRASAAALHDRR
jgi:hypothetical protein